MPFLLPLPLPLPLPPLPKAPPSLPVGDDNDRKTGEPRLLSIELLLLRPPPPMVSEGDCACDCNIVELESKRSKSPLSEDGDLRCCDVERDRLRDLLLLEFLLLLRCNCGCACLTSSFTSALHGQQIRYK